MPDDMDVLDVTYTDWFHGDWADNNLGTRARSRRVDDEAEVQVEYCGPIVEHFQHIVERDFIVLWAEAEYDLTFAGEFYYSDKSGKLQKAVKVEFHLVAEKYFHNFKGKGVGVVEQEHPSETQHSLPET